MHSRTLPAAHQGTHPARTRPARHTHHTPPQRHPHATHPVQATCSAPPSTRHPPTLHSPDATSLDTSPFSPHLGEVARASLARVTELCGAAFWRKNLFYSSTSLETSLDTTAHARAIPRPHLYRQSIPHQSIPRHLKPRPAARHAHICTRPRGMSIFVEVLSRFVEMAAAPSLGSS